ncbi:MAG: 50S ribosomal protein L21 [Armatimonadetes bacterium]|nr:50S ribosomal protein L21 [Armatimonadota bacterium]
MYAIVEAGGRQHRAEPGRIIKTEKLSANVGEEIVLDRVLALHDGEQLRVGSPYLSDVRVVGRVVQQGRGPKIRVFKYKPKKRYRRTRGHRQPFTVVEVLKIETES